MPSLHTYCTNHPYRHSSPLQSPLTTTIGHQTPPYATTIIPTALFGLSFTPLHNLKKKNHPHNPTLSVFFLFYSLFDNCNLFQQIVVVFCVVLLVFFARGGYFVWDRCSPLRLQAAHQLFDKSPEQNSQCLGPLLPFLKPQVPVPNPPNPLWSSGR